MPQGFNGSDVNLSQKSAGKGQDSKRGSPSAGSLRMAAPSWPSVPGKTGPNRQAGMGRKVKQHTQDTGI